MEVGRLVTALLLILFISGADCHRRKSFLTAVVGEKTWFCTRALLLADVLYKVSNDEAQLLFNTSRPSSSYSKEYHLRYISPHIELLKARPSYSGVFRLEGWLGGRIRDQKNYSLVVCSAGETFVQSKLGSSVQLCGSDSRELKTAVIQLYRRSIYCEEDIPTTLILDNNSPTERLPHDLRGRLLVDLENSSVVLHGLKEEDLCHEYECLIWREGQCQNRRYTKMKSHVIKLYQRQGEQLTLPCSIPDASPHQVYWKTPSGEVTVVSEDPNLHSKTEPQMDMYTLNVSLTGDYSLIVPSDKFKRGYYSCIRQKEIVRYDVRRCHAIVNATASFSRDGSVFLDCLPYDMGERVQWFRRKNGDPEELIVDSHNETMLLPEDLRGRVQSLHNSYFTLAIYNSTPTDSGVYTCRMNIYPCKGLCLEKTFHLYYSTESSFCSESSFRTESSFYTAFASLMCCGLLAMVSAVILVNVRNRRRAQASQAGDTEKKH